MNYHKYDGISAYARRVVRRVFGKTGNVQKDSKGKILPKFFKIPTYPQGYFFMELFFWKINFWSILWGKNKELRCSTLLPGVI